MKVATNETGSQKLRGSNPLSPTIECKPTLELIDLLYDYSVPFYVPMSN